MKAYTSLIHLRIQNETLETKAFLISSSSFSFPHSRRTTTKTKPFTSQSSSVTLAPSSHDPHTRSSHGHTASILHVAASVTQLRSSASHSDRGAPSSHCTQLGFSKAPCFASHPARFLESPLLSFSKAPCENEVHLDRWVVQHAAKRREKHLKHDCVAIFEFYTARLLVITSIENMIEVKKRKLAVVISSPFNFFF